jgi:hypothetical protein
MRMRVSIVLITFFAMNVARVGHLGNGRFLKWDELHRNETDRFSEGEV